MKLKIAAALAATSIAGLGAGCDTKLVDAPPNFKQAPQVVAVYAVDQTNSGLNASGTSCDPAGNCEPSLPDVLIYSKTQPDRTSAAPPSYGSFRVEFDQPVDGASIANNNDLTAQSYCSNIKTGAGGKPAVQLLDGSTPIFTSVCYNPTSNLGQNPSVIVTVGQGAALASGPSNGVNGNPTPFTCQEFFNETGTLAQAKAPFDYLTMRTNRQYSITVDPSVRSSSGQTLNPDPSNTNIKFSTSGFDVMAAGQQDITTGYFSWLDKPFKGFEKDLDAVGSAFVKTADTAPILIVMTEPPAVDATTGNVTGVTVTAQDSKGNAIPTADYFASPAYDINGISLVAAFIDPRVITVSTGDNSPGGAIEPFEPGSKVTVALSTAVAAVSGDKLTTARSYTFNVDPAPALAVTSTTPADGSTDQSVNPAAYDAYSSGIVVEFQSRVNPASVSAANVTITPTAGPGKGAALVLKPGDVALATAASTGVSGFNNQRLYINPTPPTGANTPFVPGTTYSVKVSGLKSATGATFADKTFQFTTVNFSIDRVTHPTAVCAGSADPTKPAYFCPYGSQGFNPSGRIDRRVDVAIFAVVDGGMKVRFTDSANGVSTGSVHLNEVDKKGVATPIPSLAVASTGGGFPGSRYTLQVTDPNYVLKFGQLYKVQADNSITDSEPTANATPLTSTGCTDPKGCGDNRTFTTRLFNPSITTPLDPSGNYFVGPSFFVTFPYPVDTSTFDLVTPFKLYQQKSDGTLTDVTAAVGLKCSLNTTPSSAGRAPNQRVTCTPASALQPNTTYLASAIFTKDKPAIVAPKISAPPSKANLTPSLFPNPTDQAVSGRFVGSLSRKFTTACP